MWYLGRLLGLSDLLIFQGVFLWILGVGRSLRLVSDGPLVLVSAGQSRFMLYEDKMDWESIKFCDMGELRLIQVGRIDQNSGS